MVITAATPPQTCSRAKAGKNMTTLTETAFTTTQDLLKPHFTTTPSGRRRLRKRVALEEPKIIKISVCTLGNFDALLSDDHWPCAEYADDDIYNEALARPLQEKAAPMSRFFRNAGQTPVSQRIDEKKRGIGKQRYPFVGKSIAMFVTCLSQAHICPLAWTLAVVMLGVFIYELVLNGKNQGTPISFHASNLRTLQWLLELMYIAARGKPHARSIAECTHQRGRALSSLYERGHRTSFVYTLSMYAAQPFLQASVAHEMRQA